MDYVMPDLISERMLQIKRQLSNHSISRHYAPYRTVMNGASPALIYRWAVAATESPFTFWEDTDGIRVVLSVAHCVLLGFLDMTLVEQSGIHYGIMACCIRHWSRSWVPSQLSPPLQAKVNIKACPSVEGQRIKESLHGVQDTLKEWKQW